MAQAPPLHTTPAEARPHLTRGQGRRYPEQPVQVQEEAMNQGFVCLGLFLEVLCKLGLISTEAYAQTLIHTLSFHFAVAEVP